MKTLVIHPKDKSTEFLKHIYENQKNVTIISGGMTQEMVHEEIKKHDRIIMCGHGSPHGLFSVGQFKVFGLIIDRSSVKYLKDKECIFIWCNANIFVEQNKLNGFYSGMFISEVVESIYCGVPSEENVVNESNIRFVTAFAPVFNNSLEEIHNHVKNVYGTIIKENKVAEYNHNRLYLV